MGEHGRREPREDGWIWMDEHMSKEWFDVAWRE